MICKIEDVTVSPVKVPISIDSVQIDKIAADLVVEEVIVNKVGC